MRSMLRALEVSQSIQALALLNAPTKSYLMRPLEGRECRFDCEYFQYFRMGNVGREAWAIDSLAHGISSFIFRPSPHVMTLLVAQRMP